jgi:S-DNA-T family DNA segregation ATPase FtsK/SpoIIIE
LQKFIANYRQIAGLLLLFLSIAGLFSVLQLPFYRDNVRFGGTLGYLLAHFLEAYFNRLGAALVLLVGLFFAITLNVEFSINTLLDNLTASRFVQGLINLELTLRRRTQAILTYLRATLAGWKRQPTAEPNEDTEDYLPDYPARNPRTTLAHNSAAVTLPITEKNLPRPNATAISDLDQFSAALPETNATTNHLHSAVSNPHNNISSTASNAHDNNNNFGSSVNNSPAPSQAASAPIDVPTPRVNTPAAAISNRSGRDLEELHKIVYGEANDPHTIEEFSLSGAMVAADLRQEINQAAAPPVLRRRNETAKVANLPPAVGAPPAAVGSPPAAAPPARIRSDQATLEVNAAVQEMLQSATIAQPAAVTMAGNPPASAFINTVSLANDYVVPGVELFTPVPPPQVHDEAELWERAQLLAEKCQEFSVTGKIHHISPGPVVTTFEFKPDPGVKYSRITNLADDLCLALRAESIRIERLPGKSTVGIEVPNIRREIIYIREIFEAPQYRQSASPLTLALGKTIDGQTHIADLAKMPHLLIAGATGTGKSVCLNSVIVSLLHKASPDEVKMIMVDPKRLELGLYEGIPHLLTPIVLDPQRASNALKWAVGEMESRYKMLAGYSVRNIEQYNNLVRQRRAEGSTIPFPPLPFIVIIIDELADLMMVASNDVETSITRLAQMARAVGIHLVIATQRPSVDVITGLIKANFPSRISFRVSSKVDSRTILDTNGAETLLGQGDMLFLPPGTSRLVRVHGAYVGESEIGRMVEHIRQQREPEYDESIQISEEEAELQAGGGGTRDELFEDALRIVCQMGRASTSVLQRRLRIGYGRAAAILDMMELEGYVGPSDGSKPRVVKQLAHEYVERLLQIQQEV